MKRIVNKETIENIGKKVKVCGWVNKRRDHGKLIFIDLRDRSGILQVVFTPKSDFYKSAQDLRSEWVVEIEGEVKERPENMVNDKIETGSVELKAESLKILNTSEVIPFSIEDDGYDIDEKKRLEYRYLDLRRKRLQDNLKVRQKSLFFMRNYLQKEDFTEIETPILTKSTPEGARDFVVPARLQPGKFYALPQSPQQYKQLLMVAGMERYFQIARCLRDEDPRADRQAEFTQLDVETSFMSQEEILNLTEDLFIKLVKEVFPEKKIVKTPFPRITFKEAMEKYGTDRPDIRENKDDPDELAFCFVTDFPAFEWHKESKTWGAMHHPFTQPQTKNIEEIKKDPGKILAYQYDLVLNGWEIGGGSLRVTDLDLLCTVFEVFGHSPKEIKEKFKNYFEAFKYGVPPHGGIAIGFDRFLALMLKESSIREVIAFPKTGDNRCLMMETPSEISEDQLKELHIKTLKKKEKEE
jgi:aspartyl-tRNA synthetase